MQSEVAGKPSGFFLIFSTTPLIKRHCQWLSASESNPRLSIWSAGLLTKCETIAHPTCCWPNVAYCVRANRWNCGCTVEDKMRRPAEAKWKASRMKWTRSHPIYSLRSASLSFSCFGSPSSQVPITNDAEDNRLLSREHYQRCSRQWSLQVPSKPSRMLPFTLNLLLLLHIHLLEKPKVIRTNEERPAR